MMKKVMLLIMIVLLTGCNQDNKVTSEPIDESVGLYEAFIGTWIYDDEEISVIHLSENGTFATNDTRLLDIVDTYRNSSLVGEWSLEESKVTFHITQHFSSSGSEDQSATVEAELKNGHLYVNNMTFEKEDDTSTVGDVENFIGEWHRTKVHQANTGYLSIEKVEDNFLFFEVELYSGGNTGSINGIATFISDNQALYIHNRKNSTLESILFKVNGHYLEVESTSGIDKEFGMGVFIDGVYTLDEPEYTNENIMIDTFTTEYRIETVKNLLGDEGFSFLETVMSYGSEYKDDDLTYSGFTRGVGYGVNLLMTDDNYIYCLTYGQEDREVYYTNDPKSKGLMHPKLLDKVRDFSNLHFVYNDKNESMNYDDYVWIRGHYSKPSGWNEGIKWEREMDEYIEVIMSGEIYDFQIVSLSFDEDYQLIFDSPIYELKTLDQTFFMNTYHPEGIPSEAFVFKDKYGVEHSYVISERSLRGDLFDLNEIIIPLDYKARNRIIKTDSDNYIAVPYLSYSGDTIESYVPEGWLLLDSIDLDFNDDGILDKVGVIEKNYMDKEYETWDYPRILFGLKGSESGFVLDFEDVNLVRHAREGGIYGDPYLPLTTNGKDFEIHAYGGSAWRWSERSKFTYIDGIWYLKEKEDTYGYGPYVTNYALDYYDRGYGVRKYNNQDFDSMGNGDPTEYDLEFEVPLGQMQSLPSYSENWWLSNYRLGQQHLKDIITTKGVSPLEYTDIAKVLNNPLAIKDMNMDSIIYHVRNEESDKEHLLIYNRKSGNVKVFVDAEKANSYHVVFEQVKLEEDGIYYIENHILEKDDASFIEKTTIHRLDFDGNHEILSTIENKPIDGEYNYFSVSMELIKNQMLIEVYRSDVSEYYKLNYDDLKLVYLGQVTN